MRAHLLQHGAVVTPVFHELAGDLDGIPFNAVDARGIRFIDGGQDVLKHMAEFVEERGDLAEAQEGRLGIHGQRLVADHQGQRQLDRTVARFAARVDLIHPGTAALGLGATVGVEIKSGDRGSCCCADCKEAHVGMPDGNRACGFLDGDVEEIVRQFEETIQHGGEGEVAAEFGFVIVIQRFALTLAPEGDIPGFERSVRICACRPFRVLRREDLEIVHLGLTGDVRSGGELVQQVIDGGDVLRCFHREAQVRKSCKAEQRGFLPTQFQNTIDERRVVELTG